MKAIISIFLLIITISSESQTPSDSIVNAWFKEREKTNRETIGKPFPPFSCTDQNLIIDNDFLKGKTVFINFWYEACEPCIAEFDAFNELYEKLRNITNFMFISFTFESTEKIKVTKEKYRIQYNIFSLKESECMRLNNKNGYPTSIIIDSFGLIRYRIEGGDTNKDKAREFVLNTIYPEILKVL